MIARLLCATMVLLLCGCDPQLAMSSGPSSRKSVEGCDKAVARLKSCCPAYDSFVSCSYSTTAAFPTTDISEGQSRCLLGKSCDDLARAVTANRSLCGVTFHSQHCR